MSPPEATAAVFAGGGERALAWELGAAAGLLEAGQDLRRAATIIGTSAGSLAAAWLADGVAPGEAAVELGRHARAPLADPGPVLARVLQAWRAGESVPLAERRARVGELALTAPGVPAQEAVVARIAQMLPSREWPPSLRVTAIDAASGELHAFDHRSGVPLERGVAASRAIPGLLPPIEIDGRRYMDGAIGSAANAALASGAALAVVVAPFRAAAPQDTLEGLWARALDAELVTLAEYGTPAACVHANAADMAAMGPDLLSARHATRSFGAGLERGRMVGAAATTPRAA